MTQRKKRTLQHNTVGQQRGRNRRLLPGDMHRHEPDHNAYIHCGWGRLLFAQTFDKSEELAAIMRDEAEDERDIAIYVRDPHVLLAAAPQALFLDPSHTMRLWLAMYRQSKRRPRGFRVRRLSNSADARAINRIYAQHNMVPIPLSFLISHRDSRRLTYLIAEDLESGEVIGTVSGVDHVHAFNDPESGSSLWCLAVDVQAAHPGIGEALVRSLAEHYQVRGRSYMDLSVLHDNEGAQKLYEALGFEKIQLFSLKNKSAYNEKLFIAPAPSTRLNPYARIICDEARRRGIVVEIEDEETGLFRLSHGGRTISCYESLSDLTTAVALTRCSDKALTLRLAAKAQVAVPAQIESGDEDEVHRFLQRHGKVVVKPASGEQGRGVTVGLEQLPEVLQAIVNARQYGDRILVEAFHDGEDLRVIVIDNKVVAAAIRRPPQITGNGNNTVAELIQVQSRRRAAKTGGESRIPLDDETRRCVEAAGYAMDSVLPEATTINVRRTANLHTGGTIHDVTEQLHADITTASVRCAEALQIPVVGLDFVVTAADQPQHVLIEANERPGLANHEPQPTAQRFIDLLFPHTCRSHA